MNFYRKVLVALLFVNSGVTAVHAGIIIGGTRVIYDGNKKEASISVNNPDSTPYLIQSWIETQNGGAEKAPFVITPPLYRLDSAQQNIERIILTSNLPQDKESLYWLSIKAIPSAPKKDNSLQIAVKTSLKLIYRPAALKGTLPEEQAETLRWSVVGNQIQVANSTPFVMNFNEISVDGEKLENVTYVLPQSTARFNLPKNKHGGKTTFVLINDYGGPGKIHNASI